MQNFTPTTSFAIILVQATSMSPLGFCQASWLQLCPFFSPVIYELLSHPSLSPSETCQAHHNFHKSSPSSPSPTALCGRPSCPMASGPITSWEIDGETVETVADFNFLGSKITANGDPSHEIKRHSLEGKV